jgi:hypothetical protein
VKWQSPSLLALLRCGKKLAGVVSRYPVYSGYTVLYSEASCLGRSWGFWHLPFFFGPLARTGPDATLLSATIALIEFSIGLTGLSVVMTWALNNCGGSTLLAILIHAAFDSSGLALVALFPSTPPYYLPIHYQTLGIAIAFSIAALVLIVVTRGDLSYQRYQREVG